MSDKLLETNDLSEDCRQLSYILNHSLALQTVSWGQNCRKICDISRKEMLSLIDNKNKQKSNSYHLVLKDINQELALFSLIETKSSHSGQKIVSKSATLSVESRLLFGFEERIRNKDLFPMGLQLDLFFNIFDNLLCRQRISPETESKSLEPLNGQIIEEPNHMMEIDFKPDVQIDVQIDAKPFDSSTISQTNEWLTEEKEKEIESEVKGVLNKSLDIIDKCLPKPSNYVKIKKKSSSGSKSRSKRPSINYLNLMLKKLFPKSSCKQKSKNDSLGNENKKYRKYTQKEIKEIQKRKVKVLAKKFEKWIIGGEVRYLLKQEDRMRVPYTYFPLRVKKKFLEPQKGRDDSHREEVHKPIAHMSGGPKRITNQEIDWKSIGITEPNIKALNYWSYDIESEPIVSPKRVRRV